MKIIFGDGCTPIYLPSRRSGGTEQTYQYADIKKKKATLSQGNRAMPQLFFSV